jgi:predicted membrane-bound spermidine synthase
VSFATEFQRVDVFHVMRPTRRNLASFLKSQRNDGSYESLNKKLFAPDTMVFLDGILQSCASGDAAYHESLVHPSMFAHNAPRRVAIIGGGEGATLREVLKHKTVEKVVMIEIDEMMVSLSREYIPFWSDCSTITGAASSCFDDPRVEMRYEDAFKFFIDNFSSNNDIQVEPFDVIIMDALYVCLGTRTIRAFFCFMLVLLLNQ